MSITWELNCARFVWVHHHQSAQSGGRQLHKYPAGFNLHTTCNTFCWKLFHLHNSLFCDRRKLTFAMDVTSNVVSFCLILCHLFSVRGKGNCTNIQQVSTFTQPATLCDSCGKLFQLHNSFLFLTAKSLTFAMDVTSNVLNVDYQWGFLSVLCHLWDVTAVVGEKLISRPPPSQAKIFLTKTPKQKIKKEFAAFWNTCHHGMFESGLFDVFEVLRQYM